MFDDAISMIFIIWSSLSSWFTPTFLFLFLNLMIGTIFITSSFSSSPPKPHHPNHLDSTLHHHPNHLLHPSQHQQPPPPSNLARAPSLLQRLKSVNFYSYSSAAAPQQQQHQQQNLSSTSNPSAAAIPELGLSVKAQKVPAQVQTRELPELGLSGHPQKASARVQTRELRELGLSEKVPARLQTQTQVLPELRLEKFPARAQTQTQTQTRSPIIEEDMTDDEGPTLDEIYSRIKGTAPHHHHSRQNSDTNPTGGEIPVKLPAKMKKSASVQSAFNHFEAEATDEYADVDVDEATMEEMEKLSAAVAASVSGGSGGGSTEVDAMADDFINRFKKQLELQRNESIARYKDIITRGSEK